MAYRVIIPNKVRKQLAKLPSKLRLQIVEQLTSLGENPRPFGYIKLKGFTNQYRIRIQDYRILYEINDDELIVLIIRVDHRKQVYKKD